MGAFVDIDYTMMPPRPTVRLRLGTGDIRIVKHHWFKRMAMRHARRINRRIQESR